MLVLFGTCAAYMYIMDKKNNRKKPRVNIIYLWMTGSCYIYTQKRIFIDRNGYLKMFISSARYFFFVYLCIYKYNIDIYTHICIYILIIPQRKERWRLCGGGESRVYFFRRVVQSATYIYMVLWKNYVREVYSQREKENKRKRKTDGLEKKKKKKLRKKSLTKREIR